jgi:LmbE family N-acetylglucosaminyl deacetylase
MVTALRWRDGRGPCFRDRVLIAAPHPDDEVLGCAGVMAWLHDRGARVEIIAVTDGDASHARSTRVTRSNLVERRSSERARALAELGLRDVRIDRLGLPDAGLAACEPELRTMVERRLDAETTLIVPWRHDGHPDHEAVARAGLSAARAVGSPCLEVPIWARVRGRRCSPSHVLDLGAFRARKVEAVQAYRSQIIPLGPDPVDGPVVHPDELEALTSPTEWLVEEVG